MAAGIELFNMFARLSADDSEFTTKIGAAGTKFRSFVGNVQGEMTKINSAVNKGLTVLAGAATAVVTVFGKAGFNFNSQMETYTNNFEVMLGRRRGGRREGPGAAADGREDAVRAFGPGGRDADAAGVPGILRKVHRDFEDAGRRGAGQQGEDVRPRAGVRAGSQRREAAGAGPFADDQPGVQPAELHRQADRRDDEELRDRMSKGKIGIDEITQAFEDATSEGRAVLSGMEKASTTLAGKWSTSWTIFRASRARCWSRSPRPSRTASSPR